MVASSVGRTVVYLVDLKGVKLATKMVVRLVWKMVVQLALKKVVNWGFVKVAY